VARKEIKVSDQQDNVKDAKRHGWLDAMPDNFAVGAALWDAQDAAQAIAAHGMRDAVSPGVAVAIGLAGVALSKFLEHRRGKGK
jgi:hypothetical protein